MMTECKRLEALYGVDYLLPEDDFQAEMIEGKLQRLTSFWARPGMTKPPWTQSSGFRHGKVW
jgi:hypothetical protein